MKPDPICITKQKFIFKNMRERERERDLEKKGTDEIPYTNLCYSSQGSQYRTEGCTGLASGTIYFGYRSIPVYHFGFTAILYIYMYVCMYVSVYIYIYIIINIKVYHKTFSQFRTNYLWFYTLESIKWEKK